MNQTGKAMEPLDPNNEMTALVNALNDNRDSWVLLSLALKDLIADAPSPWRDPVMRQVERQLLRIKETK